MTDQAPTPTPDDLTAMKAQRDHWAKLMMSGALNASEVTTFMKLRAEIALMELQHTSTHRPKAVLPGFDESEDGNIQFTPRKAR
jgi:hypothetical protein